MITKINEDLKQAMRNKDTNKLNVLRALKNEVTNASLRKGNIDEVISNIEIIALVRKEISKRQDSLMIFTQADRNDLMEKEIKEIEVLAEYLPEDLSDEDLSIIIDSALTGFMNPTKKDMGRIIKLVQEDVDGRADNKRISAMVGSKLQ